MITRVWHGKTLPEKADDYLEFLLTNGTREYRENPGNVSAKIWRRTGEDECEFMTITEWKDTDAIKRFAGEDFDKAVYYPEDEGVLLEFEEKVRHFESHDVSVGKIRGYLRQLDQLERGGSWQGESFSQKLDDLTEDQAFMPPAPGVHSVAEIVWHCTYWRTVLLKRFQGDQAYRDNTMKQLNFLPVEELRRRGWRTIRTEFDEARVAVENFLRSKTDAFLHTEYQDGRTYEHLVEGIIHHDIYHLGQIGLVRKMITMS